MCEFRQGKMKGMLSYKSRYRMYWNEVTFPIIMGQRLKDLARKSEKGIYFYHYELSVKMTIFNKC